MSIQAMDWVMKHSKHKGNELVCLLMIANHANGDGCNAFPSFETLAKECRMTERNVKRLVAQLEEGGELFIEKGGYGRGTRNNYNLYMGRTKDELCAILDELHRTNPAFKGDKSRKLRVTESVTKGDNFGNLRVTESVTKGDNFGNAINRVPVSEPSINRHSEPSIGLSLKSATENIPETGVESGEREKGKRPATKPKDLMGMMLDTRLNERCSELIAEYEKAYNERFHFVPTFTLGWFRRDLIPIIANHADDQQADMIEAIRLYVNNTDNDYWRENAYDYVTLTRQWQRVFGTYQIQKEENARHFNSNPNDTSEPRRNIEAARAAEGGVPPAATARTGGTSRPAEDDPRTNRDPNGQLFDEDRDDDGECPRLFRRPGFA